MAVKKAKTQKQDAPPDFCAYIGPTLRGVVQSGTLFPCSRTELLDRMSAVSAKYPEFGYLVVQGKDLAGARKTINQPGTLLHSKCAAMLARIHEGGRT